MDKIKYIPWLFVIFLLFQCKTNQLGKIKKEIMESYSVRHLNKEEFDESRNLMIKNLSPEIVKNDTIILLEYFTGVNGNYSYTLYESTTRQVKRYVAQKSIRNRKVYVDSLRISNIPDKILKMARMGKLDEIKQRGDATTITPAATLIVNIGIKDREKEKFNFTTLVTQEFSTSEN
jgi:hypothetical protein